MIVPPDVLARLLDAFADTIADRVAAKLRETRPADGDELLDARRAGVAPVTWRAAIRRGELRGSKVGRAYVARRADVHEWLARRAVPTTAPANDDVRGDAMDRALAKVRTAR